MDDLISRQAALRTDCFGDVDSAVEVIAWMPLPEPYKENADDT